MRTKLSIPLISLLLVSMAISKHEESEEFAYNGFKPSTLHLDGISQISANGLLVMTNTTKNQQGHAFLPIPLQFKNTTNGKSNSFSTQFIFAIVSQYADVSTHGLAFLLSPTRGCPGALPSQYLGLFNSSNNGNSSNHILAVELDTIYNIEFGDINNNHVGIDINGLKSIAAAPAAYFVNNSRMVKNLSLYSGVPMQVWVEYSSQQTKLNVTLSPIDIPKPINPLLSLTTDLSLVLHDSMYIGFSASSGSVINSHYVLGWSFKMNGDAPPLNLSGLPSLPPKQARKKPRIMAVWVPIVVAVFTVATISAIIATIRHKIKYAEVMEEWEKEYRPHRFSYRDLYRATQGFSEEDLLGVGGFGRVYKGKLPNSKIAIAVKRVSHDSRQGMREFVAEIVSIGQLRHRNLVQLLGYCRRKQELLLVYEFMSNGSLDKYLYDQSEAQLIALSWNQRFHIIKGVASGLLYLHEECEQVVIHRDIKASNVLLDAQLNAKLGDFGLSKLYDHGTDPSTTHVVGTLGYIAPEISRTGRATTSTDVFAFGVFLLEVVCGRRPILHQESSDNLIDWVWRCWRRGAITEARDVKLGAECQTEEVELVLKLGLLCSHPVPAVRPSMREVVQLLNRDLLLSPDEMDVNVPSSRSGDRLDNLSVSYLTKTRSYGTTSSSGTEAFASSPFLRKSNSSIEATE